MPTDNISGYVLLSMPTTQVQPLYLLSFQKKNTANITAARLDNLFVDSEVPLPVISGDLPVSADINKTLSVEISVDNHLALLEGLLKFMKLSASFKLQKNKSVNVQLFDAKKNNVNEFNLDAYINSAKLNRTAKSFVGMLEEDELYVVTDILKCKKYSLEYTNERTMDAALDAGASMTGDTSGNFHAGKSGSDKAVNEGDEYITIGVKAYRIYYLKDKKTGEESYRIRKDDVIRTILDDEDFPGEMLSAEKVNLNF
ncbi:MAG: hypothetical protein KFF73_00340 [Cyclobacteriaceae bacterium]|nr:hypothetical protein [Cyclobacteriaceae bacterium]